MKRLLTLAAFVAILAGCSARTAQIPGAHPEFAKIDYRVLGNTNAESCGTYIFGIDWGHLFDDQAGFTSGGGVLGSLFGGMHAEAARAIYMALEKIPEATHLLSPRVHTSSTGLLFGTYPLFGERCSYINSRGVVVGSGPIPAAQLQ